MVCHGDHICVTVHWGEDRLKRQFGIFSKGIPGRENMETSIADLPNADDGGVSVDSAALCAVSTVVCGAVWDVCCSELARPLRRT